MTNLPQPKRLSNSAALVVGLVLGAGLMLAGLLATGRIGAQATPDNLEHLLTTTTSPDQQTTSIPVDAGEVEASASTTELPNQIYVAPDGTDDVGRGRSQQDPVLSPDFAVSLAVPGDTIHFAEGTYSSLTIEDKDNLIIVGDKESPPIFTGAGYDGRSGVLIRSSSNIELRGIQIESSLWGLLVKASTDVSIVDLIVRDIGQEGILISDNSSRIEVSGSLITQTGMRPGSNGSVLFSNFGEGVYVGTGGVLDDGSYDGTSEVSIHHNEISFTTAEAIDIKPSVTNITISDNIIHDISTSNSGAVVVGIGTRESPDPLVAIERNAIYRITRTSPWTDGNAIVLSAPAIVRDNLIWDVQHHGIVVDANLMSLTPSQVVVSNNLVFQTGLSPIQDSSQRLDIPIEVFIADNYIGAEAITLVEPFDPQSPEQFIQSLLAILLEPGSN